MTLTSRLTAFLGDANAPTKTSPLNTAPNIQLVHVSLLFLKYSLHIPPLSLERSHLSCCNTKPHTQPFDT